MSTWILTGSLENFRINVERGFDVIGFKEGRRRQAEEFEPGDEVVFYVTGVQAFGGIARVRSTMFEDREPIWPAKKKGKKTSRLNNGGTSSSRQRRSASELEAYPWRVEAEADVVLDEADFVDAGELAPLLEHAGKWPAQHWHLAFQGQLRTVSEADARLLRERIEVAAGVAA